MAPIVQGTEDGVTIGEIEFGYGCEVLTYALEIAQVHSQGLKEDALYSEVVADGDNRARGVAVADVEDCVPGTFLEPDDGLAAGHGEGADVDPPLFQDVRIAFTKVGALEAIQLADVQLPEVLGGIDRKGMGLSYGRSSLQGTGLWTGIDGVQILRGEAAGEGLGLGLAHLVERGVAGALEAAFLIGVGLSVSC